MKLHPMLLAALIPIAAAQNTPTIIGTLPNRDNANITFTLIQGECPKDQYLVYTQADGGKISMYGCYRLVSDQFFVKWSDGDIYTYPSGNLILSDEFLNYMNRNKK